MAIYKLNKHSSESEPSSVTLNQENGLYLCIPFVADNIDYQEYLEWVAAGNTADGPDAPEETKADTKETTEQPTAPSVKIPVIDIQMPLPTAEVVTTATYAAVAAVATTTLATPFFDQIKKKLTKFLQGKINKWKEKRKKKKDSSES